MKKMTLVFRLPIALVSFLFLSAQAGFADILEEIDALRLPSAEVTVSFLIRTSDGTTTRFSSDQDGKGSSLATIVSSGKRGEKYLYTPNGLWLFVPGSRRTIRIPKIQSLRGETVVGDITQLRFADQYRVERQSNATRDGKNLTKLRLVAKSRSSTFRTIELFVNPSSFAPVYAEYFLTSGKLLRTAEFGAVQRIPFGSDAIDGVAEITFRSSQGNETRLMIERIESQRFANGHFTPNAIQR